MLDKDAPALQNSYLLLGHIGIRGKITPEITGGAFCTQLKGAQSAAIDFRYEHNPKKYLSWPPDHPFTLQLRKLRPGEEKGVAQFHRGSLCQAGPGRQSLNEDPVLSS